MPRHSFGQFGLGVVAVAPSTTVVRAGAALAAPPPVPATMLRAASAAAAPATASGLRRSEPRMDFDIGTPLLRGFVLRSAADSVAGHVRAGLSTDGALRKGGSAVDCVTNVGDAGVRHAERVGGRRRQVPGAAGDVGAAVDHLRDDV